MSYSVHILETIDFLYRAAVEPKLWPSALHRLARTVGGVGTAMIPITPGNTVGLVVSPDLKEPNIEYERGWWRYDTRVLRIHSRKLFAGVCCEAQLFTDKEIARDPLRQEFLRSYGIGAFAAHLSAPVPDLVVAVSVQRALHKGPFQKRELELLNLLGKHAARALAVSTRLANAHKMERTLQSVIGRFDCGALLVDKNLRVLLANQAAERLIGDGLTIHRGRLYVRGREQQSTFECLMKHALGARHDKNPATPIRLPGPNGDRPLLVHAIPISTEPADWDVPTSAAALVLIVDTSQGAGYNPAKELRLLGLTPSEARLGALIGGGLSRSGAAAQLQLAESTVSDTVKQIYLKLGISRQSQLTQLVERLAVFRQQADR